MQRQRLILFIIFLLVVASIFVLTRLGIQLGLDLKGGAQLTIQVEPTAEVTTISSQDLNAVKVVLANRVNVLGVSEPVVQTVGNDKVSVQLPGVTDPSQAEKILGGTAQLEFREQKIGSEGVFIAEFQNQRALSAQLTLLRETPESPQKAEQIAELTDLLAQSNEALSQLFEPSALSGKNLEDARPQPTQSGNGWQVIIRFDNQGGQQFAELTKKVAGTGRSLGIFLDDALISAPNVDAQYAATGITGGRAEISGNFTVETANDLAVQLKGGSLPFPVSVVENRTVGATLGQDSINRSIYAGLAGLILVLIFMAIYYRLPGVIADIALIIYAVLTLACFSLVNVTLTLPGIAGFILSIGMAVDANVLIFERTREELRAGRTLFQGVKNGFYRAFSSILDSNVTTLIACGALFFFGSGLVKGFALTLGIGVAVSMFTALTCSRTLMLLLVLGWPGLRQNPALFCPNLPPSVARS